ncbi:MAG: hypothetical protein ACUVQ0_01345 [Thermoproteota archaeon]
MKTLVREHYGRQEVRREIAEYCRGRWVAIRCEKTDSRGLRMILRYGSKDMRPLTISSEADLARILEEYAGYGPKVFYATVHVYRKLDSREDVADRQNIVVSSPDLGYRFEKRRLEEDRQQGYGNNRCPGEEWAGQVCVLQVERERCSCPR